MKLTDLTLDSIAGGALPEKFEHQLKRVLENILDPNTEAKAKRGIDVKIVLEPGEDRSRLTATVSVSAKLAPPRGDAGQVYLGQRGGEVVAVTYDPEQADLFTGKQEADVVPLGRQLREGAAS